jgi:hypothetical protein
MGCPRRDRRDTRHVRELHTRLLLQLRLLDRIDLDVRPLAGWYPTPEGPRFFDGFLRGHVDRR